MSHGFVLLDDDIVGTIELDADEKISVKFTGVFRSVSEMLEYSAEQGVSFSLMAYAEVNDYTPKHQDA